ncbi:MAG: tyrosine--tRNA ligase [Acidimicrobiaceae bacterium]|nr:tyrosine--tRNA ligase [Acidimicrobiaceae bacterium]
MTKEENYQGIENQLDLLILGSEFGDDQLKSAMRERLRLRLEQAAEEHRPLRVYTGYDPSAPDLHLGHSITLRKLRQFQDLGHDVTVVVGTMTATIGDTSDRASGRPRKTAAETAAAAQGYGEQCFTILDRERTRVVANGDWLSELTLTDVLGLASNFTVQQFLVRDNYRLRIDRGEPIALHEFFYTLLQGFDAVHLEADVQLGATEQLFNILAGAKLQEAFGQPPCVALTFPILVGTDGIERMSKSRGNYIGLTEAPNEQFGKVMSVSDETMIQWVNLVTDWSHDDVVAFRRQVQSGELHPMQAKKQLAHHLVSLYHGVRAADEAQAAFENTHQRGLRPDNLVEVIVALPLGIVDALVQIGAATSKSAARRLLLGGAVEVNGVQINSDDEIIDSPSLIKVGPRRFYRIAES